MAKGQTVSSLAGFLREHYTNSRESAAALASYLMTNPAGVARQPETPRHQAERKPAENARAADENARGRRNAPNRNQRGRQATAEHAPPVPEPPRPPPQPQFDIFD